ncbi:M48 family metallopeptidase [Thalassotalea sp. Y01]|uniref:M48 family metallopeptidase n=1 Tax=Thalassotalea sp. Y01 TaxID=2729613 RepID=UPI00145EB44B|nr:M48 family metallopeptidase [Thalassotalea sp. Y01]NMP16049.1 M48 family metallopeptidase [Thalassotalea sp. Y01]
MQLHGNGKLMSRGQDAVRDVKVRIEDEQLFILDANNSETIYQSEYQNLKVSQPLGSIPCDVLLSDGNHISLDRDDPVCRFLLEQKNSVFHLVDKLERSKRYWLPALVLVPILFYLLINVVVPGAARSVAHILPVSFLHNVDQESIEFIAEHVLDETEISEQTQRLISDDFDYMLQRLQLNQYPYDLRFYKSEAFGANAFALPGGTIVVTDDLVNLFAEQPQVISAILLHEIAHVEHRHGMQAMAESLATTLLLSYFFGDLQGMAELFSGTALTVIQNNFSRDLEAEADDFALEGLDRLDRSADDFAKAMQGLFEQQGDAADEDNLGKYFSTHPALIERINKAKRAAEKQTY